MMKKLKIHTHPWMERSRRVKKGHVIIDGELFLELLNQFGPYLTAMTNTKDTGGE